MYLDVEDTAKIVHYFDVEDSVDAVEIFWLNFEVYYCAEIFNLNVWLQLYKLFIMKLMSIASIQNQKFDVKQCKIFTSGFQIASLTYTSNYHNQITKPFR